MGVSIAPGSGDRITANVAAMRQQGATEADIESYLTQTEGLKPESTVPGALATMGSVMKAITPNGGTELLDPNSGARHMLRSAVQGATFNYGDEILRHLPSWLGGGEQAANDMQAKDRAFRAENPHLDMVARGGGAVASGLAAPELRTAGLLGSIAKGALIGGGGTALAVSGDAAPGQRMAAVKDNAAPIALATLLGGAIPAAAGGVAAAGRGSNRLVRAVNQSGGKDAVLAAAREFKQHGLGDVATLGDLSDPLRAASKYAVQNSEEAAMPRIRATQARNANTPQRMMDKLRELLPEFGADPNAEAALGAAKADRRAWAQGPDGFGGLRDANPDVPNTVFPARQSPDLAQALADLKGAKDMGINGKVIAQLQSKVDALRPPPMNAEEAGLASVLKQPKVRDALARAKTAGFIGATPEPGNRPSFEKMFQIKQDVQDAADRAITAGGGKSQLGFNLKEAAQLIDAHLAENVPDYAGVSHEYATRMGRERAFDLGKALWQNGDSRQIGQKIGQLTQDELHNARLAMASEAVAKLRNPTQAMSFARQVMSSAAEGASENAVQDKLLAMFGTPEKFASYMQYAHLNHELGRMTGAYSGSDTYRNLMAGSTSPLETGVKAAAARSPLLALKHAVADHALLAMRRRSAAEMAGPLMTTGADITETLNKLFAQRAPLTGKFASQAAPNAIPAVLQGLLSQQ